MKRLKRFTVNDVGVLFWKGQKVLTIEELTIVLWPCHKTEKKHIQDEGFLRKVLSDKGYAFAVFHWWPRASSKNVGSQIVETRSEEDKKQLPIL